MTKQFTNTRWNYVYNEAIRILEIQHSEKEIRQIKAMWIPTFKEFGFDEIMTKQIDLMEKVKLYQEQYEICVAYVNNVSDNTDYKKSPALNLEEFEKTFDIHKAEISKDIKNLQLQRTQLTSEFNEIVPLWKKYETIYKRALLCYTSSFYHPQYELLAMRLTYNDKFKFECPEQVEMCYHLAKSQRKSLQKQQKELKTTKYLNRKMMNYIIKNQEFLNFARTKKHEIKLIK